MRRLRGPRPAHSDWIRSVLLHLPGLGCRIDSVLAARQGPASEAGFRPPRFHCCACHPAARFSGHLTATPGVIKLFHPRPNCADLPPHNFPDSRGKPFDSAISKQVRACSNCFMNGESIPRCTARLHLTQRPERVGSSGGSPTAAHVRLLDFEPSPEERISHSVLFKIEVC